MGSTNIALAGPVARAESASGIAFRVPAKYQDVRIILDVTETPTVDVFTPTDLAGLTWWGDHTTIPNPGEGNPVLTWPGLAGTPTITAIVGERPLYHASGPNAHPYLHFDGVDDCFLIGDTGDFLGAGGDGTLALVASVEERAEGGYLFIDATSGQYWLEAYPATGYKLLGNSGAFIDGYASVPLTGSTWCVAVMRVISDVVSVWVNLTKGTDKTFTPNFNGANALYMSSGSFGDWTNSGLKGDVTEGLIYNVPLSDSDIETKLIPYLITKSAIA